MLEGGEIKEAEKEQTTTQIDLSQSQLIAESHTDIQVDQVAGDKDNGQGTEEKGPKPKSAAQIAKEKQKSLQDEHDCEVAASYGLAVAQLTDRRHLSRRSATTFVLFYFSRRMG